MSDSKSSMQLTNKWRGTRSAQAYIPFIISLPILKAYVNQVTQCQLQIQSTQSQTLPLP